MRDFPKSYERPLTAHDFQKITREENLHERNKDSVAVGLGALLILVGMSIVWLYRKLKKRQLDKNSTTTWEVSKDGKFV